MPSPGTSTVQLQPGQAFGKYLVEKALGQGGMGTVYKARDTRLNRNVALKMCTIPDNADALERFRREAQAAAQLSHTNLCPVFDYDVRDGTAYIAMAFIEGPSLADWLKTHSLEPRNAARLILKLARAMQEAHEAGVIHRDLKPGNVAISKKGEPVILDFGLARQVDDQRSRLTQSGGMMGTPSYMAPEQAMDAAVVGPAADVYSLGVILYEVMTRKVPFSASSVMALMMKVVNDPPEPPSRHNPAIEPELEAVCLKALAKTPQERYGSMQEFAIALARAIGTQSKTVVAADATAKPAQAPPPLPVGIPALPMSETVPPPSSNPITATVPWQDPLATKALASSPKGRRSSAKRWLVVGLLIAVVSGLGVWGWQAARGPDKVTERNDKDSMEKPPPQTEPTRKDNSLGMKFVKLPKGTFYMGGGSGKAGKETKIKEEFEIAVYTVTQGQWQALMGDNPSYFSRRGEGRDKVADISDEELRQFPVEDVSWDNAQAFLRKLNEKERGSGWTYRLPTEIEWEYACRAGATSEQGCSYDFYFDKPTNALSSQQANFNGAKPFGGAPDGPWLMRPSKVGSYQPNALGLYDMHGNVYQWCTELYKEGDSVHVLRGGAWGTTGIMCRAAARGFVRTTHPGVIGLRLIRVPSGSKPVTEITPPPPPKPGENALGMKFVKLPKGTFYMGGGGGTAGKKTEIKEDFEIAIHTVTQGQWQALMNNNPSHFSRTGAGRDWVKDIADADLKQFPVENVLWDEAQECINKLNEREKGSGWMYRLPTEAEWEYACRAGATSEADCSFHFYLDKLTNDLSSEQANFDGNKPFGTAPKGPYLQRTTKVGSYRPNRLGVYDMYGNVWQWCADWHTEGSLRVIRGGCWDYAACQAAYRYGYAPAARHYGMGFRVVRVPSSGKPVTEIKPPPTPQPGDNSLGMKFVKLPKGTFYMGWDDTHKGKKTEIKEDFEIAIYTVTQDQWQTLMKNNPSYFSRDGQGKDKVKDISDADLKQFPVEQVSWEDAQMFIEKLNEREKNSGWLYRLPTEAEWEYSCRGGTASEAECSFHYYFDKPTNDISPAQANFNSSVGRTTKVDAHKPNKLGVYDMHGNVLQWCADWYAADSLRVFRGGSWPYDSSACRAAYRAGRGPAERNCDLGFRVARVPSGGK